MGTKLLPTPDNQIAVQAISYEVLLKVVPNEVEESQAFLPPLVDMALRGEEIAPPSLDKAGGLGNVDLMVMVVIPVVVAVLSDLLVELGKVKVEEIKEDRKKAREAKALKRITYEDIAPLVKRVRPASTKKEICRLVEAVNKTLLEYLE